MHYSRSCVEEYTGYGDVPSRGIPELSTAYGSEGRFHGIVGLSSCEAKREREHLKSSGRRLLHFFS